MVSGILSAFEDEGVVEEHTQKDLQLRGMRYRGFGRLRGFHRWRIRPSLGRRGLLLGHSIFPTTYQFGQFLIISMFIGTETLSRSVKKGS